MITAAAGYKIGKVRIGAGYQYISGQDGSDRPFDTLYSTAHKFNGWADVFISTNGGKLMKYAHYNEKTVPPATLMSAADMMKTYSGLA